MQRKLPEVRILYLDCFGGISGDMTLGALIDAGIPLASIQNQLELLGLEGYSLQAVQDKTHGFRGTRFTVELSQKKQPPRTWKDISQIIEKSELSPRIKKCALGIFEKLAWAEGRVHGVEPEKVHFHELGATDALIDIVGTAVALREAGVEKVYCSPLPTGYGSVQSCHGLLPLPAPAAAELLKGLPVRPVQVEGELVTPTGAAIVAALASGFGPLPAMNISRIGYGLGSNDYGRPNFLRVFIGEEIHRQENKEDPPPGKEQIISILQTGVDDLNPEILAYTIEKLFAAGALDALITPVIMKKGRPGSLLTVLCLPEKENSLLKIIFAETTTLGVRTRREKRYILPRQEISVETGYGTVRVKIAALADAPDGLAEQKWQISPEYEDCRQLAQERNIPLKNVYQAALKAAEKTFDEIKPFSPDHK